MNATIKSSATAHRQSSDCESCARELADLLGQQENGRALMARFRPIANLLDGGILGHFASIHGPPDSLFCLTSRLFAAAIQVGLGERLVRRYFDVVVGRFVAQRGSGMLLFPMPAATAAPHSIQADALLQALAHHGLAPQQVIAAFSGLGDTGEPALADTGTAVQHLHAAGVLLAAQGIACKRTEAHIWAQQPPDFALVEDGTLDCIPANLLASSHYAKKIVEAAASSRRIIVQGANALALLRALQELPVAGACGDFVGKPVAEPTQTLSAAAHKAIAEKVFGHPGSPPRGGHVLEKLLRVVPPVAPNTPADKVFALFEHSPDLRAIAVVKDEKPQGLIARFEMVDNMARPFRHELYGRKPCTRYMDTEALNVELRMPLAELSEVLVNAHPRHLISGFIICDNGRYLGIGSVQDLVREVTSMQMEAAKYANPLSQLPGNVPINQFIDDLLQAGEPCTIAYCDLDHFKPFNDVYGYARGDDVIRLTAQVLTAVIDSERDFIGHVGGDDFVLVFRSSDWRTRCETALARFGSEILGFFSVDDIERGGYVTENRKGQMEFHALMSLSIGAAEIRPGTFRSHLEVSVVAAEVKKKAKSIKGNSLYVDQRTH